MDILYPNEDVQMSRVLGNISSRGTLFAIIIEPINEDHDSLTVNILHGTPEGKTLYLPTQPEMDGRNDVDSMEFSLGGHQIDIVLTSYL